jgi:hypothetical protein
MLNETKLKQEHSDISLELFHRGELPEQGEPTTERGRALVARMKELERMLGWDRNENDPEDDPALDGNILILVILYIDAVIEIVGCNPADDNGGPPDGRGAVAMPVGDFADGDVGKIVRSGAGFVVEGEIRPYGGSEEERELLSSEFKSWTGFSSRGYAAAHNTTHRSKAPRHHGLGTTRRRRTMCCWGCCRDGWSSEVSLNEASMTAIKVVLAHCCQNYIFNLGGKAVVYSHKDHRQVLVNWEDVAGPACRLLEVPFGVPSDPFEAHQILTEYLDALGNENHGYSIGEFFELPLAEAGGGGRYWTRSRWRVPKAPETPEAPGETSDEE